MLQDLSRRSTRQWSLLVPVVAQSVEDTFPEDTGSQVVFLIVGVGIVGLYLLLRQTRRRNEAAYWERRRREKEQRDNDPDMRGDQP